MRKLTQTGANLEFEDKFWMAADKLRGMMDSAEYKHVVLGRIFLKYISDSFLEKYDALKAEEFADPEDRNKYLTDNVFWVPTEARWSFLKGKAKDPKVSGQLIDLIATIGLGDKENREKDVLGRVYEYFLAKFAEKEGKGDGESYIPRCVVRLLVEMLKPYSGHIYDSCCGSGGVFVPSVKFVQAHSNGNGSGIPNGVKRGIDVHIEWTDSFLNNKHKRS